jgi:hypothetical protein
MVGQSDAANPMIAPGGDGGGSGVPQNNAIQNWTNLANAVAVDVAGVYRTVNSPPPAAPYTYGGANQPTIAGFGLMPILLIGLAAWLIFK